MFGHDGFVVPPSALLEQANAHEIVKRLELEHGIGLPERREPTTRETIGYRAIAWNRGAMVKSRYSWTVRGERPDDPSVVHGGTWLEGVLGWPSMTALRERWGERGDARCAVPVRTGACVGADEGSRARRAVRSV
ncbi:TY-Chap2 family putative peptide chaperone [Demequina lignilytica]|uniref:TY-Chap2 family putative peptide chaperone n=1 Tax=Demequina lignilytica TaxID=3051663 RepID=UPI003F736F16